jgi:FMN phosphatase YigB (HAD superfamily)
MNTFFLSFILLILFNVNAEITSSNKLTKENSVIAFDLDDTLTEYAPFYKFKVVGYGLSFNPKKSWQYLNALNAMRKLKKKKHTIPAGDDAPYQEVIGGGFLQLTYAGIQEKDLRPYISGLIDLIWTNASFKAGIPELLTYLYDQGYELWIATNKDHVSYTQILDSLDNRCSFKLSSLIQQSFVVWPTKETIEKLYALKPRENSEFQRLIDIIPTISQTNTIHHSNQPKPSKEYYEKMKAYAKGKKIIFFDDKKTNTIEAKKYDIQAYRINNCSDIIARLEKLNILDPNRDSKFYEQLNEKTFFKKILFWV